MDEEKEMLYEGIRMGDWGNYLCAIDYYTDALKIKQDYVEALFWRGATYCFNTNEYNKAVEKDSYMFRFVPENFKDNLKAIANNRILSSAFGKPA